MDSVNEKSSSVVTADFTDENGAPVTPATASYRIDDVVSGTEIKGDTAFVPVSSSHDIKISSNENRILNPELKKDVRIVTVQFTFGADGAGSGQYKYEVINLKKVA